MHWLNYVFFGLMFALGAVAFVLFVRAKEVRAWIWLVVSLAGAAGIVGLLSGHAAGQWRPLAMGAMFDLFAADHLIQYLQSRRKGAPKQIQLWLGILWLLLGLMQVIDFG